ncbi:DUF927 domain-containing protein [Oscillospiraceae bacterium PP1C4]
MNTHKLSPQELELVKQSPIYPFCIDQAKEFVYQCRIKESEKGTVYLLEKICRFIRVSKILCSLDDDEIQLDLTFLTSFGLTKTVTVSRQDITKKKFEVLTGKGINIHDKNCSSVLQYLNISEAKAPVEYHHTKLGWYKDNDAWVYRHHITVGSDVESIYSGNIDLCPKGSLAVWTDMVRQEVIGQTALELILVAGFSSMLIPRLKNVSGYESLFLHMVGNSSTGKTTAEILAISAFANPMTGGLIKKWTATQNALMAAFDGNFGLPIVIDESSAAQIKDFTSFIYMFSQGHGRERAKSDGSLREAAQWGFTLISSGEARLPKNNNIGLDIRLLELCNIAFTDSAENADNIRRIASQNYGHAAIELAKHLTTISDSDLESEYWNLRKQLLDKMKENEDKFSQRTVNRITLLIQTACQVNDALGLGLRVEEIAHLLIDIDCKQERDIGQKALDAVEQYFTSHFSSFLSNQQTHQNHFTCGGIGTYKEIGNILEIVILTQELRKILNSEEFTDLSVILSRWKEMGILDCEADRFTRKRKIGLIKATVYVLKIPK